METYKYAQTGPGTVKITGFKDKEEAYKLIEWSMKEYEKKFKDQKRRFEPPADPAVL